MTVIGKFAAEVRILFGVQYTTEEGTVLTMCFGSYISYTVLNITVWY